MKNESAYAKKFSPLLKRVLKEHPPDSLESPDVGRPPVMQMVVGFLQYNTTREAAEDALGRLMNVLVDTNDIRVSHYTELIELVGADYPQIQDRIARMHDSLQAIFLREHAMEPRSLEGKSKKEIRAYYESLPGMAPYVLDQVMLLCYGAHAVPVDDVLAGLLREEKAVEPNATPAAISSFIERQIKAGEGIDVHAALQAWADASLDREKSRTRPSKKAGRKKAAKKAARKSAAKKSSRKAAKRK